MSRHPEFKLQLHIPEPCSENWNAMDRVGESQRHCASCATVVTDFTQMSDDEVLQFFQSHQGKVCGRLRSDQMKREFKKPIRYDSYPVWWKHVALVPLMLFSKEVLAQAKYVRERLPEAKTQVEQEATAILQYEEAINDSARLLIAGKNINVDTLRVDSTTIIIPPVIGWWRWPEPPMGGPIMYYGGIGFLGTYTVTLTVTDVYGDICIVPPNPPVANMWIIDNTVKTVDPLIVEYIQENLGVIDNPEDPAFPRQHVSWIRSSHKKIAWLLPSTLWIWVANLPKRIRARRRPR